jgi:hypothetical protein
MAGAVHNSAHAARPAAGRVVSGMRRRRVLLALAAAIALIATGVLWWWSNPQALPGAHRVSVYALEEDISGSPANPPGFLSRLFGMCDADRYYVEQDGRPYCLILSGDLSTSGPLAWVHVTKYGGDVVIGPADVKVLRDIGTRAGQLTGGESRTLVLVYNGPVAVVPVSALAGAGDVRVAMFD